MSANSSYCLDYYYKSAIRTMVKQRKNTDTLHTLQKGHHLKDAKPTKVGYVYRYVQFISLSLKSRYSCATAKRIEMIHFLSFSSLRLFTYFLFLLEFYGMFLAQIVKHKHRSSRKTIRFLLLQKPKQYEQRTRATWRQQIQFNHESWPTQSKMLIFPNGFKCFENYCYYTPFSI